MGWYGVVWGVMGWYGVVLGNDPNPRPTVMTVPTSDFSSRAKNGKYVRYVCVCLKTAKVLFNG